MTATANSNPHARCKHTCHHQGLSRKKRRGLLRAYPPRQPYVFAGVVIPR
jgi:hypothetical protein